MSLGGKEIDLERVKLLGENIVSKLFFLLFIYECICTFPMPKIYDYKFYNKTKIIRKVLYVSPCNREGMLDIAKTKKFLYIVRKP